ncbi:MAG: NAD(P)H-dependent oxidoreductase [Saprospiraceae bacterium]|nr:NAD(P)H-dependent oxidoreductase [Saprospiraceae bacterium]MDW8229612.1 NAD(P)H-dependent oxidoreductase [Saprospiraceae bacterium]
MQIAIFSASTRLNRQSHRVTLALKQWIEAHTSHRAEILDLAEYRFPVLEEVLSRHPNPPDRLADFARRVRESDAFLFVSPEYNGGYTAALKNAVDYLKEREFAHKVIGVVSVSAGALGGIRAALAMQQLVLGIAGYPVPQMLTVGQVQQRFDEQGKLLDAAFEKNIQQFMDGFLWLSEAVCEKRASELAVAG